MRFLRRTPLLIAASSIALLGAALPASGADTDLVTGGNPPAGWTATQSAQLYANMFGSMSAGQPQGIVIADSGFRPYPHGFPLPNWGTSADFAQNRLIYGGAPRVSLESLEKDEYRVPSGELNSLALRRTLGDGVCRDEKSIDPGTGECELILGAELLAQMIEANGLGGHCFGMAAAAAALYNGQIPANQVGASGLGLNAANPMGERAVQTITRLFGTQFLNADANALEGTGQSPTSVVQTLVRELPAGQVPYVLTMISLEGDGGHAITPYAVTDRGDGIYAIAVYDNNFPFQALAVTIDTNTDTFDYTSATDPNSPSYTWSTENNSVIGLVPVAELVGIQDCPVCRGKDQGTLVALNALNAENADQIGVQLVDRDQQPLDESLYRFIAPLNPENTKHVSVPVIEVEPGVEFGVTIITGDLSTPQPIEIYAISNGASEYLLLEDAPSNNGLIFGVGGTDALYVSNKPTSPRIQQLYDGRIESIDINGHPLALPGTVVVNQRWNRAKERVRYSSSAKQTLRWNVQVSGIGAIEASWVGLNVPVPPGASILVDYGNATRDRSPQAWVVAKDGTRTVITLQPVTQSLIDKSRDQIYVTQGPS